MAERTPSTAAQVLSAHPVVEAATGTPPSPVDRMPRRRRNQICIAIIAFGLLNFLVYTLSYAILGGDAHNGYCKQITRADGRLGWVYVVRGHHVRLLEGLETEVSRAAWIYSYLHSITVPLTSGALIISMLVLARPHIIATMRDGWIGGQTFVTAFGTIVVLASLSATALFIAHFVAQLSGI
jgi:hypothetical protein